MINEIIDERKQDKIVVSGHYDRIDHDRTDHDFPITREIIGQAIVAKDRGKARNAKTINIVI